MIEDAEATRKEPGTGVRVAEEDAGRDVSRIAAAALDEFVRAHSAKCRQDLSRRYGWLLGESGCDDVFQVALIAVWEWLKRHVDRKEAITSESLVPLFLTVVMRQAWREIRRKQRRAAVPLHNQTALAETLEAPPSQGDPGAIAERRDLLKVVMAETFDSLSQSERWVLAAWVWDRPVSAEDCLCNTMAKDLGTSPGAIRGLRRRALEKAQRFAQSRWKHDEIELDLEDIEDARPPDSTIDSQEVVLRNCPRRWRVRPAEGSTVNPLAVAFDQWMQGKCPLPMEIGPINYRYYWEELGGEG